MTIAEQIVSQLGPETLNRVSLKTVDIEINGICNLACPWCWGPEHTPAIETVTNEQWGKVLDELKQYGTESVVITGGETLLRPQIPSLLSDIKNKGLRVTLSTNGTRLQTLREALPFVDDLGLPIDGYDSSTNQVMRVPVGNSQLDQFTKVLEAIEIVKDFPSVDLTIRTVVSKKNFQNVSQIGGVLTENGYSDLIKRWKLYQVSPEGPRHDTTTNEGWMIDDDHFLQVVEQVKNNNPTLADKVKGQTAKMSLNRYVLIDPSAQIFVIQPDNKGLPMQFFVGNAITDLAGAVTKMNDLNIVPQDRTHGV